MKTLIVYIVVIILFAGIVLPLKSNKVQDFKYRLEYKIPDIEKNYIDSSHHALDSIIDFSERNLKYLESEIPKFKRKYNN